MAISKLLVCVSKCFADNKEFGSEMVLDSRYMGDGFIDKSIVRFSARLLNCL